MPVLSRQCAKKVVKHVSRLYKIRAVDLRHGETAIAFDSIAAIMPKGIELMSGTILRRSDVDGSYLFRVRGSLHL